VPRILRSNEGKVVFEQDGARGVEKNPDLVVLTLQPKSRIGAHTLPVPATFFVIRGTVFLTLSTENITLFKGDLIAVDPGQERAWDNLSDQPLQVLVIKSAAASSA
jgi:quercetin dioxygenase-like cupin family protein